MVTDRYLHEHHHPNAADLAAWAAAQGERGIPVIGVDNLPGSAPIETTPLPRECVLVFGQEGPGLTAELLAVCDALLHITQFGSTRSLNAGAAAAIALHTWALQHVHGWQPGPQPRPHPAAAP